MKKRTSELSASQMENYLAIGDVIPWVDAYRTLLVAPPPEMVRVLTGVRDLLAAAIHCWEATPV